MLGLTILPSPIGLEIDQINASSQEYVTGILSSVVTTAPCPSCGIDSSRVQSEYTRTVADLPWAAIAVILILQVRRFFCDNPVCKRKIFCERLPSVVKPYRRKTVRLEQRLQTIAYAEGGESGARTANSMGMKVSPDTMLRQIRSSAPKTGATPRVLGVDDFSFRRGQRYGTILIDLEKHERVDVLPDRNAESFAEWLKEHPGVEYISRDRGQIYADGARKGAPDAKHIADRFHLVQNIREAVERLLNSHHQELKATTESVASQIAPAHCATENNTLETVAANPAAQTSETQNSSTHPIADELSSDEQRAEQQSIAEIAMDTPLIKNAGDEKKTVTWQERSNQLSAESRQRRLDRYQNIKELSQQGMSGRAIARYLDIEKDTVRKFLKADIFPERSEPKRYSMLDRFIPYMRQRWEAGVRNCRKLWTEIQALGFAGSLSRVKEFLADWRKELPLYFQGRKGRLPNGAKAAISSPRQISFWLLGLSKEKTAEKKTEHQNFVEYLCNICDEVSKARKLGIEFIEMIRKRQSSALDPWLEKAKTSGLPDLKNFALGIERDKEAVENALKFEWSNGQVEGNNNRLKMIKRQMYGRAKIDLLRARVLHPT